MSEFFRFPHTPHLAWLGEGKPRDDKILSFAESEALLKGEVSVEEKLDGANIGLSLSSQKQLQIQNRGQFLTPPYTGQFLRLSAWLRQHEEALSNGLNQDLILFGEWCAAKHSLSYDKLPDWFLLFDVYDRQAKRFWSRSCRDTLARKMGIAIVPLVHVGSCTTSSLKKILLRQNSKFRIGPMEGIVIRRDSGDWCVDRAKLVRSDFIQAIEEHWRRRKIEWNCVDFDSFSNLGTAQNEP